MLQDDAVNTLCRYGVQQQLALNFVNSANEQALRQAIKAPDWALFYYWKNVVPDIDQRPCSTGRELANALHDLGFRDDIVAQVPKDKEYGHLSARGWARHFAIEIAASAH